MNSIKHNIGKVLMTSLLVVVMAFVFGFHVDQASRNGSTTFVEQVLQAKQMDQDIGSSQNKLIQLHNINQYLLFKSSRQNSPEYTSTHEYFPQDDYKHQIKFFQPPDVPKWFLHEKSKSGFRATGWKDSNLLYSKMQLYHS